MWDVTAGLLLLVLHAVAAVVVHELAHVGVGVALGGRVEAVGWGWPQGARHVRGPLGVVWFLDPAARSGVTVWLVPRGGGWSKAAWTAVVAAGPGINLLLGVAMLGTTDAVWVLGGALQLLHGVVNLLPVSRASKPRTTPSDGDQLFALWRGVTPQDAGLAHVDPTLLVQQAHAFGRLGCPALASRLLDQVARVQAAGPSNP